MRTGYAKYGFTEWMKITKLLHQIAQCRAKAKQLNLDSYITFRFTDSIPLNFLYRCHLVEVILTVRVHLDKIVDTK